MEGSSAEVGGIMEEITWTVGSVGTPVPSPSSSPNQQMEYVPTMKNNPKSTPAEKESVRLWNLMVSTLRDNGLMKEKE